MRARLMSLYYALIDAIGAGHNREHPTSEQQWNEAPHADHKLTREEDSARVAQELRELLGSSPCSWGWPAQQSALDRAAGDIADTTPGSTEEWPHSQN